MTAPLTALEQIQIKVRRITKMPSVNQITDAQINDYINTFYLYDMPEELRLFQQRVNYSFQTLPNVDTYDAPVQDYITFHQPLYIAGYESYLSQSETEFFRQYPKLRQIQTVGSGDGGTFNFPFTVMNIPIIAGMVLVSAGDQYVTDDGLGVLSGTGTSSGTVDYITGAFNVTFTSAPLSGEDIVAQVVPYVASRPAALLYFDTTFTLRPIPDQVYTVTMDAYQKPTALLQNNDDPKLKEWWQYIAMGAAIKIFEDRGDFQLIQSFGPLFERYKNLINRRTLVQQSEMRSATIYTEQYQYQQGNYFGTF
jgi:hypothetical protein